MSREFYIFLSSTEKCLDFPENKTLNVSPLAGALKQDKLVTVLHKSVPQKL
jgi:hypothetical protein